MSAAKDIYTCQVHSKVVATQTDFKLEGSANLTLRR